MAILGPQIDLFGSPHVHSTVLEPLSIVHWGYAYNGAVPSIQQ